MNKNVGKIENAKKRFLSKNNSISRKKANKKKIHQILSEYTKKRKQALMETLHNRPKYDLALNKTYNIKPHSYFGKKISNKKKIEEELFSLSKENRTIFTKALKKHNFQMEVYIPQNLTNKEQGDKALLINQLIHIDKINKKIKEFINPINTETNQFSQQYRLIKGDKGRKKSYMKNVEKLYQLNGYDKDVIEYKENENIFAPSFLLDQNFGKDQQKDASKYINKRQDFAKDHLLLQKFDDIIWKKEENKGITERRFYNKENWNYIYNHERDEQLKKEVIEEQKIMNMTKKQYRKYKNKLKKEIYLIKKKLSELDKTKTMFNASPSTRDPQTITIQTIATGASSNRFPNVKEKIIEDKKAIDMKKRIKNDDDNNIFLSSRGLDLQTDFNKILPSINSIVEAKSSKEIVKQNSNTIENSTRKRKKPTRRDKKNLSRRKKNQNLYKLLSDKVGYKDIHIKDIEKEFRKYSSKKLPKLNLNNGSNIHGFLSDFQNQVKDNSFKNIAKGNENIRIDMNKRVDSNYNIALKNKIEKVDDTINNLHFSVLERLLANNRKELVNN